LAFVFIFSVPLCLCGLSAVNGVGIPPRLAIERSVAQRIGAGASVTVASLDTTVVPTPGLEALPDPAARSGQPVRFQLLAHGARVGTAVATVRVQAMYARAARAIARDEAISDDMVAMVDGEVPHVAFRHLPTRDEIAGLKARRDIAPGEALTDAVLVVPPLVRSGEEVAVTVRIGAVQAQGMAVASGSGHLGDTIRVMQRSSRKLLNARISGPGAVELIP
jgi:flagella basal body P-ring formation protein FlgA